MLNMLSCILCATGPEPVAEHVLNVAAVLEMKWCAAMELRSPGGGE
jgi:hypothetical protein